MAIASPLLEISIEGAKGVLFNITGGRDLTMTEVDEAAKIISTSVDTDANIIFGATIDENLVDQVKITVVATGFDETKRRLKELSNRPTVQGSSLYGNTQPGYMAQKPQMAGGGGVPSHTTFAQPKTILQSQQQPQGTPLPPIAEEEVDEDELDIPAFLRQRN
jgi:cell division protein FtsZ